MAIKIIKLGKTPDAFRFKCPHCGCVFDADRGDYEANDNRFNETEYWASCPTCHYSTCRSEPLDE